MYLILTEKLKLLDRISKAKTLEIEKLIRQKESKLYYCIQYMIYDRVYSIATDKVLIENQKEIETLQEKTTLLTLELKNREERINQLIKNVKSRDNL